MFRGEAAVLASLDDPNVIRLHEYVEGAAGAETFTVNVGSNPYGSQP